MRKPIEQRIMELEEHKRALQSRLEKQERARTTRRRILLGTFLLDRLRSGKGNREDSMLLDFLQRELPAFLSRDADRVLFTDLLAADESAPVQGGAVGQGEDEATSGLIQVGLSNDAGERS